MKKKTHLPGILATATKNSLLTKKQATAKKETLMAKKQATAKKSSLLPRKQATAKKKRPQQPTGNVLPKTEEESKFEKALHALAERIEFDSCGDSDSLWELRRTLKSELRFIRTEFQSRKDEYGWKGNDAEPPRDRIVGALEGRNCLIGYLLADMAGETEIKAHLEHSAVAIYVADSELLFELFGDLLPEQFIKQHAPLVAQRRYREGSNATARHDWKAFDAASRTCVPGLRTGLPSLDEALGGGLRGLTIIGADEGDGKTSLAITIMVAALRADPELGCVFFTIDQDKTKTMKKLLCHVSGLSWAEFRPADGQYQSDEQKHKAEAAEEELKERLLPRIKFVERGNLMEAESFSLATLQTKHRALCQAGTGVRHVLTVIDMFQTATQINHGAGSANDLDESLLEVFKQFLLWTRNSDYPEGGQLIVTSEVRKVDRVELGSNDLKGSARLGSVPDNIFLLWPPKDSKQEGTPVVSRTLHVSKTRDGDEGRFSVDFHHKLCRFSEKGGAEKSSRSVSNPGSHEAGTKTGKLL